MLMSSTLPTNFYDQPPAQSCYSQNFVNHPAVGASQTGTNLLHATNVTRKQTCHVNGSNFLQIGKIPPPRPKPPTIKQTSCNNKQQSATAATASSSPAVNYSVNGVQEGPSTSAQSRILAADASLNQDNSDPFEISMAVKDIAHRGLYSELFREFPASTSSSPGGLSGQSDRKQLYNSKLSPPSAGSLGHNQSSSNATNSLATSLGFTQQPAGIGVILTLFRL
ncbi:unnamed protein product [Gongylonema pulchrum]|uniref:Uncharacterized protein n=1 Tax=Gongylonema pulchrum TaxID=637853 RepID=A0A183EKD1_9BILA|nr:unnamed protein product [Gongylonema pulchrum]